MNIYIQKEALTFQESKAMSSTERKIFQYIMKSDESYLCKIMADLNIKRGIFKKCIKRLQRKGLVVRSGQGSYLIPNKENIIPIMNEYAIRAHRIMSSNPEKYDEFDMVQGVRIPKHSIRIEDLERL